MTTEFATKLIDLYLDGHMDLEMVSDFREAMRADATLAAEVEALRTARANLHAVYEGDVMTNDENRRVYQRLMRNADPSGRATQNPAGQLEIPWSDTKHE